MDNLSVFDPASPPAEDIRELFVLVLVITGVIFVLVEGVLIYSVLRFRAGPSRNVNAPPKEPPQVYGSAPIELAWTAGPALVVFLLILVLSRTVFEVRALDVSHASGAPPGAKPLHVTVIGHQFWWEYVYEEYDGQKLGFATANELRVPAGEPGTPRPALLKLKSADVIHSFWVPRLAGKMDLIPGRTNTLWFQSDRPGVYLGQCAEFCGTQHANMMIRVIVEAPADFQRWLDNEKKPAVDDPKVRAGRDVFLSQACVNCHRVRGTRADGTFGPDLTHLMSRATLATGMVPNNRAELRKWVVDPQTIKPGCLMPAMKLPDREVDLVVDYLMTLK
jgi:cytochrome c oxidase subunit 2